MRLIDADVFRKYVLNGKPIGLTICQYSESDILYMINQQPTITSPPNDPLTLEQLLGMGGEPVWCVDGRGNQCWCLVNCDDGFPCCYDNETGLWEDCYYGMRGDDEFGLHKFGWLAYRRKPEKGTA